MNATTHTPLLVVLGAGESGTGAALLGQQQGYRVFVSDLLHIKPAYVEILLRHGIAYEQGQHSESRIFEADCVVKSPGIADSVDLVQRLRAAGKPVIDEVEFAARYALAPIIAITGSNGKTTTTRLTHHLLHQAGKRVALVGNIGISFARAVAFDPVPDYYVLEVSSFQLDGTDAAFRPFIGMLLNITPDHLDRYGYQMSRYVASKFRITRQQGPAEHFLFNATCPNTAEYLNTHGHGVAAQQHRLHLDHYQTDTHLLIGNTWVPKDTLPLRGQHNYANIMFAAYAAVLAGADPALLPEAVRTFTPDPHRMEWVGTVQGVSYINDSKATNVDAVYYALEAMTQPTIWVVGGQDKGNDYTPLLPLVRSRVKAIVALGADNSALWQVFEPLGLPMFDAHSATDAVQQAHRIADSGDTVLLSPACASFDLFRNYIDRGDQFRQAVQQLSARVAAS